ncbi:hypothetical protein JW988_04350 [Candidatus Bathyarchaeota archaeon]|nr:hypothetical protein [Candidatus Bathyarchaeota archaeon]
MVDTKGAIDKKSHNGHNQTSQTTSKGDKTVNCKICQRKAATENFFQLHLKAYENIIEKYGHWRKALTITWREYLREIERNPLTGEWTKEVASYLINNEETKNGEEI